MTENLPDFYVPGDLSVFGDAASGLWGGPDDPDPVSRAARIQDQVAGFVRDHLRGSKMSQGEFATLVGLPREKLNRLLRGREWARLHELERMLGGCGHTMTSVSWAIGEGAHQPEVVRGAIAMYLSERAEQLAAGISRTAPAHP